MKAPQSYPSNAEMDRRGGRNHAVHFYDRDVDMCRTVAEFVAAGLHDDQPIIMATTPQHRAEISRLLEIRSLDFRSGQIAWLDAGSTLASLMKNSAPDPELFKASVGDLVQQTRAGRPEKPLRIFGELVHLLVQEDNMDGAIELERLWNDLGRRHGFSLLCAYAVGKFYRQEHWRHFQMICDQHSEFGGGIVSPLV